MRWGTVWSGVQFARIGLMTQALKKWDETLGQRYLVQELTRIPGLTGKMGQMVALKFGQSFANSSAPPPMPLEWVKFQIQSQLPQLAEQIVELSELPKVASLGQVHRARLKDGRDIAVKVRYAGVKESLENQLDLVLKGFRHMPKRIRANLKIGDYESFLRQFFTEELDYRHELQAQLYFAKAWPPESGLVIPDVWSDFACESILVQSFEESQSLDMLKTEPLAVREKCVSLLNDFFLKSLLNRGLIHTDLHPRNWGYRPETGQLVVYDFGATLKLTPDLIHALCALGYGKYQDAKGCLELYEILGFELKPLQEIQDQIIAVTELIFKPLRSPVRVWNPAPEIEDLLQEQKWNFRMAGPPWFLMLMRSFAGWRHAVNTLYAPDQEIPTRETEELSVSAAKSSLAAQLKIQVTENGRFLVNVEMPAYSVNHLEDLIPEKVSTAVTEKGLSILKIKNQALAKGLVPQIVFDWTEGNRSYRVWLE